MHTLLNKTSKQTKKSGWKDYHVIKNKIPGSLQDVFRQHRTTRWQLYRIDSRRLLLCDSQAGENIPKTTVGDTTIA